MCHGTTFHDGEDRTQNLPSHLFASLARSNNVKLDIHTGLKCQKVSHAQ